MIRIRNIYYMLSYAFHVLSKQGYKKIETEEFENAADLCACILIKGVTFQIKRGLNREYIPQKGALSLLCGNVDITESIKEISKQSKRLICIFDDFSLNFNMNRILKTTMEVLLKSNIQSERKKQLRMLLAYFSDVQRLDIHNIDWHLNFNRNNQEYRMLISICELIIKGLLQTNSNGKTKLMDFLDEQSMCRLYEKFILGYYKKEHPELEVSASQIPWNLDSGSKDMLPVMQTDITLKYRGKTLIIDAKYYSQTTQNHYNTNKIHSANLYQIFTYVKNLDTKCTGNVSGLLLYAKTDELTPLNNQYIIGGNPIAVATLDLDCDFSKIRGQLDRIAYKIQE